MLMVTSPDWINSPAHLSCDRSYRSKMSNDDKALICYQPDTLLCLSVVCDVCHCLDNCLLSCITPDQVTTDQSPGDGGGGPQRSLDKGFVSFEHPVSVSRDMG